MIEPILWGDRYHTESFSSTPFLQTYMHLGGPHEWALGFFPPSTCSVRVYEREREERGWIRSYYYLIIKYAIFKKSAHQN